MPQAAKKYIKDHLPKRLPHGAREKFEAAIEAHLHAVSLMTAALDAIDGDADLEPSIGSAHGGTLKTIDAEGDEHDGREVSWTENHGRGGGGSASSDGCDDNEPSLAHDNSIDQTRARRNVTGTRYVPGTRAWHGMDADLEEQCEGGGDEEGCEDEGSAKPANWRTENHPEAVTMAVRQE